MADDWTSGTRAALAGGTTLVKIIFIKVIFNNNIITIINTIIINIFMTNFSIFISNIDMIIITICR